jgi:hypothetical protein
MIRFSFLERISTQNMDQYLLNKLKKDTVTNITRNHHEHYFWISTHAGTTSLVWRKRKNAAPPQKMASLFDKIDTTSSGSITKSQFEQALQSSKAPANFTAAGADTLWSKLDPKGTGSVSKQDFTTQMTSLQAQLKPHHHHHAGANSTQTPAQTATQSLNSLNTLGGNQQTNSMVSSIVNLKA